jgi:hypothetical protein
MQQFTLKMNTLLRGRQNVELPAFFEQIPKIPEKILQILMLFSREG